MADKESIGLIGVGLLGSAIAERLLQSDFAVCAFDPVADLQPFQTLGGIVLGDAAAVAERCQRLILSLPDSSAVGNVVDEINSTLRDHTIVDTTTGSPDDAVQLAKELANLNVEYLDSTVAGSSEMMRRHQATILVGGQQSAFERCKDLYSALSAQTFYLGEHGSGAKMKLIVNFNFLDRSNCCFIN